MTAKYGTTQAIVRGGFAMRSANYCPNCGHACAIRNSFHISKLSKEVWLSCLNERCNWSGVQHTEITRTVTPPHPAYLKVDNLPPLIEKERLNAPRQTDQNTELFD